MIDGSTEFKEKRWLEVLLCVLLGLLNVVLITGLISTYSRIYLLPQLGWLAVLVVAGVYGWWSLKNLQAVKGIFFFGLALLLVGTWSSATLYDYSFDGMRYHQMVVYALSHGWLPWEKWSEFLIHYSGDSSNILQVNVIADEGFWIGSFHLVGSIVSSVTGSHELGKVYQWLFLWLNLHVAFWVLGKLGMSCFYRWIFALIVALNPISVYQLFSYAQDGAMSSLLTSLVLLLYLSVREKKINKITAFLYLAHLFPIALAKLPGIGYAGLGLGLYLIIFCFKWAQTRKRQIMLAPIALIAYLIFVNIGGLIHIWPVNSTYTAPKNINFLIKRLSFPMSYPGMSGIAGLDEMNHLETFVRSNLSETSIAPGAFLYKNPLLVKSTEIQTLLSRNTEYRTGGFGPLYAFHLILAGLVFLLYSPRVGRLQMWALAWVSLFFFLSGSVLPTFWARWIPHFGVVGIILLLVLTDANKQLFSKLRGLPLFEMRQFLPFLPLAVYIVNIALLGILSFYGNVSQQLRIEGFMQDLKNGTEPVDVYFAWFPSNELWFIRNNVEYEPHYFSFHESGKLNEIRSQTGARVLPGNIDTVVISRD